MWRLFDALYNAGPRPTRLWSAGSRAFNEIWTCPSGESRSHPPPKSPEPKLNSLTSITSIVAIRFCHPPPPFLLLRPYRREFILRSSPYRRRHRPLLAIGGASVNICSLWQVRRVTIVTSLLPYRRYRYYECLSNWDWLPTSQIEKLFLTNVNHLQRNRYINK